MLCGQRTRQHLGEPGNQVLGREKLLGSRLEACHAVLGARAGDTDDHADVLAFRMVRDERLRLGRILRQVVLDVRRDEEALDAWKRIENQDPVYLALVAERIMDAYGRLGRVEQGHQLLRAWLSAHASLDLLDELFHWELEREGPKAAYELVREELRRNPTLQFILLGIRTPNPTYEDFMAHVRGERIALIEVAVAKNCAAQRGVQ